MPGRLMSSLPVCPAAFTFLSVLLLLSTPWFDLLHHSAEIPGLQLIDVACWFAPDAPWRPAPRLDCVAHPPGLSPFPRH